MAGSGMPLSPSDQLREPRACVTIAAVFVRADACCSAIVLFRNLAVREHALAKLAEKVSSCKG